MPTENWAQSDADLCGGIAALNRKYGKSVQESTADANGIVTALNQFQECVRYLNTRRSSGAMLAMNSEADVQDALYLMLRPWVTDLVWENPNDKVANRFVIKDFVTRSARTVIEAKYVRNEEHGRGLSREMHDDIENYRHHAHCDDLVFFVYDPNSHIPDLQRLREQIEEDRYYKRTGKLLRCTLIVKP